MKAKAMETHVSTTPFGRRPVTLGQIAAQLQVKRAVNDAGKPGSNTPAAVNKWQLFRTLTEIRERLGVSDRALSVLNALLSFHQETALSLPKPAQRSPEDGETLDGEGAPGSCDLVVFPSNKALGQRAHGMASTTLWRHLTALVQAGLIIRRDSPNGKRYARKDATGRERFSDAFGFDLTPLVVRAPEFEAMAEELRAAQKQRRLLKERVSLHRRDVGKLIACGLDEGLPGDWEGFRRRFLGLMTPLRRIRDDRDLAVLAADLATLRADVTNTLESHINAQNMQGNDHRNSEHQSNSNTQWHSDLEPASKEERGKVEPSRSAAADPGEAPETKAYPLGLVMEACPDVRDYAPGGRVRTWSDFLEAARAVRPMIGISPDALAQAREALGDTEAHVVIATILQRSVYSSEAETLPTDDGGEPRIVVNGSPAILSAGGYLRALTEKARAGEFALGPVLMATIGQRLKVKRRKA
jgi:replication initiation protein RepC